MKKRKTSNNRSRVFEIALEGWREWKFFLGELQSFNAEGNIQETLIGQISLTFKYDTTEMTAATNEDCIG